VLIFFYLTAGETTFELLVQHAYLQSLEAGHIPLHSLQHYLAQVKHIYEVEFATSRGASWACTPSTPLCLL